MAAVDGRHWSKRPAKWGQELRATVGSRRLNPVVEQIRAVTGDLLGSSRTTYAALYRLDRPPRPRTREYERAYLLLVAIGEDPATFDIDDQYVSELIRNARDLVLVTSGWTAATAA